MDGVTVARPMLRACKNGLVHLLENVREGVGRDAVHNCGNWWVIMMTLMMTLMHCAVQCPRVIFQRATLCDVACNSFRSVSFRPLLVCFRRYHSMYDCRHWHWLSKLWHTSHVMSVSHWPTSSRRRRRRMRSEWRRYRWSSWNNVQLDRRSSCRVSLTLCFQASHTRVITRYTSFLLARMSVILLTN